MIMYILVLNKQESPWLQVEIFYAVFPTLEGYDTWVDLIILGIVDFNVIFLMDCFSHYHYILDCNSKTMTLVMLGVYMIQ